MLKYSCAAPPFAQLQYVLATTRVQKDSYVGRSLELATIFRQCVKSFIMLLNCRLGIFSMHTTYECHAITLKNAIYQNIAKKYTS